MGETPKTENGLANAINEGIVLGGGAVVQIAESLIIADVPFLGLPIIRQLWQAVLGFIAGYIEKALETGATFAVIDTQTAIEESNLSTALQNLIAAEKKGDPVELQAAIQAYAQAQSSLVHSDGSATPH
jgi:hypothetical protein